VITGTDGTRRELTVTLHIDTAIEGGHSPSRAP
jgi:hypothetical protein